MEIAAVWHVGSLNEAEIDLDWMCQWKWESRGRVCSLCLERWTAYFLAWFCWSLEFLETLELKTTTGLCLMTIDGNG